MSPRFQCTDPDETKPWLTASPTHNGKSFPQSGGGGGGGAGSASSKLAGGGGGHGFSSSSLSTMIGALVLVCLGPRKKFVSRSGLLVLLALVTTFVLLLQVCVKSGDEVLVLSPGMPVVVSRGQVYPDLLAQDVTGDLPEELQRDLSWRLKPGEVPKAINKQASPLKLLSLPRRPPVCSALLRDDPSEMAYALQYMETAELPRIPLSRYQQARDDCPEFVRSRGYIQHASEEEKGFPLAFSMMMYCDVEQAERLLRSVWRPHNFYCIHVDSKADAGIQQAMRAMTKCLPNVFLASKQNVVTWAAYNSLTPWLTCMNDLWKYSWKYFINLTGQEFPLKTNLQLVKTLKALKGTNIVDASTYSHYSRRWYETLPAPHHIRPYKGLVFIIASRGFVNFTIHSEEARDLLQWVKHTDYPDESFFSSINHNPHLHVPGSYKGNPDTNAIRKPYIGRFVNWGSGWLDGHGRSPFSWPCGGKRVRGICIFGIKDMPLLINRKELFANKFHLNYQPLALDCMEEWHLNMTLMEYANKLDFNTTWYTNLDIVTNGFTTQETPTL